MAGLMAAVVALVTNGLGTALLVVGATVAVQQIEGNLLQPLILERAVRLHALVTVWAVSAGLLVGGLLGAFLSVPLVAIAVGIGSHYRSPEGDAEGQTGAAVRRAAADWRSRDGRPGRGRASHCRSLSDHASLILAPAGRKRD